MNIAYDDEITSVVSSDVHRSARNEALDDEVVEESVIRFTDSYGDEEQDERRNLLYRGSGREVIERARQRARERQQQPILEGDEPEDDDILIAGQEESQESGAASLREPVFEPDDFVEEENPSSEDAVDENDDALLSEGIRTVTPREARLRRFRDERPDPKEPIATKSEPEPDDVEMVLPPSAAPERGRFDSIPEISAEIDLPLLRRSSSARNPRTEVPALHADDVEDVPASYERALKRAHALNAAARAEENASRRPMPAATMPRENIEPGGGVVMPDLPDDEVPATKHRSALVSPAPSRPVAESTGTRVKKPLVAAGRASQSGQSRMEEDPRRSWWRGNRTAVEEEERSQATVSMQSTGLEPDDTDTPEVQAMEVTRTAVAPPASLDLERDEDMEAFRDRLFATSTPRDAGDESEVTARRSPITVTRRQRPISPAARERYRTERAPLRQDTRRPEAERFRSDPSTLDRQEPARVAMPETAREPRQLRQQQEHQRIEPQALLEAPEDAWYEPEPEPAFDVRALIERDTELLDMTIQIAPDVPRACATCRNYRPSEQPGRGWCTNTWAFTHRQMVNETDLACDSTIGCWWLPADEEVWLTDLDEPRDATPRVDRLIAHLDPERRVAGN